MLTCRFAGKIGNQKQTAQTKGSFHYISFPLSFHDGMKDSRQGIPKKSVLWALTQPSCSKGSTSGIFSHAPGSDVHTTLILLDIFILSFLPNTSPCFPSETLNHPGAGEKSDSVGNKRQTYWIHTFWNNLWISKPPSFEICTSLKFAVQFSSR